MKSLEELTVDELTALLEAVRAKSRDARKKSVQTIAKYEDLQAKWIRNLSAVPADSPEDAESRRQEAFEKALARYPEAFIQYSISAHLKLTETACREEQLRRAQLTKKK